MSAGHAAAMNTAAEIGFAAADRVSLWIACWIGLALMCLGAAACGGGESGAFARPIPTPTPVAPAIANQDARSTAVTTDFLRLLYVPTALPAPTNLGLPPKKRVFLQASQFLVPPLTVLQDITFPGLTDVPDQILYAIRCQPAAGSGAAPILATWPNVFQAIIEDFATDHFACPAPPGATGENQAYCDAQGYGDTPHEYADQALLDALNIGLELFQIQIPTPPPPTRTTAFPTRYYAAYPAFTGLGYAVSGSGDSHLLTATDVDLNMVVPEYLLKNVSLTQANCHCIGVAPTPNPKTRLEAPLDMNVIWDEGDESCPLVTL